MLKLLRTPRLLSTGLRSGIQISPNSESGRIGSILTGSQIGFNSGICGNSRWMTSSSKISNDQDKNQPRPAWYRRFSQHPPNTLEFYKETALIFTVFGITGSSSLAITRRLILPHILQITDGSLMGGPWSFRIAYCAVSMPVYSVVLVTLGRLAGKQAFFEKLVYRMWSWLIPKQFLSKLLPTTVATAPVKNQASTGDDRPGVRKEE